MISLETYCERVTNDLKVKYSPICTAKRRVVSKGETSEREQNLDYPHQKVFMEEQVFLDCSGLSNGCDIFVLEYTKSNSNTLKILTLI